MSFDGTWTITVNSPMGPQPSTLNLAVDGDTLTGSQTAQGTTSPISNGKVDGDKISFTINVHDQFTLKHEGTISGDAIKLTMKSDQGDFPGGEITLKRSK